MLVRSIASGLMHQLLQGPLHDLSTSVASACVNRRRAFAEHPRSNELRRSDAKSRRVRYVPWPIRSNPNLPKHVHGRRTNPAQITLASNSDDVLVQLIPGKIQARALKDGEEMVLMGNKLCEFVSPPVRR